VTYSNGSAAERPDAGLMASDARKILSGALDAMLKAANEYEKLLALRNGAQALEAICDPGGLDHLHDMAIARHGLGADLVTGIIGQGIHLAQEKRAISAEGSSAELKTTPDGNSYTRSVLNLWWHGDGDPSAERTWLVDGLLPEIGTAIIAGPWGAYKTFVAIDLALSAMTRETFAGRPVSKRCGVLYIAAEAAFEVPIRLQGAYEDCCEVGSPLPFARADQCVRLLDRNALAVLRATAKEVDDRLRKKHDLRLGLVIIDTMAAAAGFDDENSNAEAQRAMSVCTMLAQEFKCLVVVVDHFGKTVETGTRGGSAKEGSADAVLAILADRDLSGNVSNPRMAVRKVRGAPTGSEIPFGIQIVDLGVDKNGKSQTTLVIRWKSEGASFKKPGGDPWPRNLSVLRDALSNALVEHGTDRRPFADGPIVRAVDTEHVRSEFYKRYPADGDTEEKRQAARRKAYNRAVTNAQERGLVGVAVVDQATFIWRVGPERGRDQRDMRDTSLHSVPDVPLAEGTGAAGGTSVPPCPVPDVPHSESPSVAQEASNSEAAGQEGAFGIGCGP
jgi:hypothetical protein